MYEKIDYNAFYRIIGDNIKRVRMEHKDSQEAFAEKIDMSRGFLSQVESPGLKGIGVSLDTLFKICIVYNVDIREFFEGFEKLINIKNNPNIEVKEFVNN